MTLAFIKQINEYVIDATIEAGDEEILACIGSDGYPTQQHIREALSIITQAVNEQRRLRLSRRKAAFQAYKQDFEIAQNTPPKRSIPEMLSDIVTAMQNQSKVPEGIILAFREQGKGGSEDDIFEIWQNLVELGLIDPGDIEK